MMTTQLGPRPFANVQKALVLWAAVLLSPATSLAALGDCSQPASSGAVPVATDCLFILNSAVGLQACTPECICAPTGTLPAKATDALLCLNAAVGTPVALNCPCEPVATDGDDFNDNKKDNSKWSGAMIDGNGRLNETSQRLEYSCNSGTAQDEAGWPWIASALPFDSDWEVQIDLVNLTVPSGTDQVNSFGIGVVNALDFDDDLYAEMYASSLQGPPARNGFYAELLNNGGYAGDADSGGSGDITTGAVRIRFDSASKTVAVEYDIDPSDGYQWTLYGSFGLAGSGGSNGDANWGLSGSDVLYAYVYGYSARMKIDPGKMWGDNFLLSGWVPAP